MGLESLLGVPELVDGRSLRVVEIVGRVDKLGPSRKIGVLVLDVVFSVRIHLVRRLPVVPGHVVRQRLSLVKSALDLGYNEKESYRSDEKREDGEWPKMRRATDWPWR